MIQRAIPWIAALYGTRAVPVWPDQPLWHHWRQLWQGVVQMPRDPEGCRGGWIAGSVLWGWIPVTFFVGQYRTLSVEVKLIHDSTDSDTT